MDHVRQYYVQKLLIYWAVVCYKYRKEKHTDFARS